MWSQFFIHDVWLTCLELLGIGLITGSVEAYEEVSDLNGTVEALAMFSCAKNSKTGGVINIFGFKNKFSIAALITWVIAVIVSTYLQIRHNYYGLTDLRGYRCCSRKQNVRKLLLKKQGLLN